MAIKEMDAQIRTLSEAEADLHQFVRDAVGRDLGLEGGSAWRTVLAFDGAKDYVQITGYKGVIGNTPRTVEAWIRTTASQGALFSWGKDAPSEKWGFGVQSDHGTPHTIGVDIGDGYIVGSTPVNDGKWHHVACVLEPGGPSSAPAMALYVDGLAERASASDLNHPIRTAIGEDLRIGTDFNNRYFQGEITEIRVWEKARTRYEIRRDMGYVLEGDEPGLAAYWKTDQGFGAVVKDSAFHHGSIYGAEWKEAVIEEKIPASVTIREILQPDFVAKTGQTKSYEAGDDGDLQKGIPWPEPRFTDNGDGTVTDLFTGLVWFKNAGFSMKNGENEAINFCKKLKHGNHGLWDGSAPGDWRLPGVKELLSLMDYSRQSPALPPGHPFRDIDANERYWADEILIRNNAYQWTIELKNGRIDTWGRGVESYVLPVRGKQSISWPKPRFTDNGDGTVSDNLTGLVWLKNVVGGDWSAALDFCNKLTDGESGLSDGSLPGDWRLPNLRELLSLMYYSKRNDGLLDGNPFSGRWKQVWSSTSVASDTSSAWALYLSGDGDGSMLERPKSGDRWDRCTVRPVRRNKYPLFI